MRIKTLRCKVVLSGDRQATALNAAEDPVQRSVTMELPTPPAFMSEAPPAETASGSQDGAEKAQAKEPVDPVLVANRVYDLMVEEIRIRRMRGG